MKLTYYPSRIDVKECKNCLYYRAHYYKDGEQFFPALDGECTHPKYKYKTDMPFPFSCPVWEENSVENLREEITQVAKTYYEQLSHLITKLKELSDFYKS